MRDAQKRPRLFAGRAPEGAGVAPEAQENVSPLDDRQDPSALSISAVTPWAESTIRNSVQEASDSLALRRKAL